MKAPDTNDEEPPLGPEEEAVLKAELEAALEAYRGVAPPDLLDMMRRIGIEAGRTHPVARRLLAAAASRRAPERSADLPKSERETTEAERAEKERR